MHRLGRLAGIVITAVAATAVTTAAPAHAALPDAFGFVLWTGTVQASGTQPATTTVTVNPSGTMTIRFPGTAAPGGVVHVTAIDDSPRWCQAITWAPVGPDEVVDIACFAPGGKLVPTQFSAFFSSSSAPAAPIAGAFGYVDVLPSSTILTQFNSAGAVNTAVGISSGLTEVRLPGLNTPGPQDGGLQVTAVSGIPARCKVHAWKSGPVGQDIVVACFGATGAPLATRFTLSYQFETSLFGGVAPYFFGYLFNLPPSGPPTPTTNFNDVYGYGINTVALVGPGHFEVVFPKVGWLPDDLQVTSAGLTSDFCNLTAPWTHGSPSTKVQSVVACYTSAGVPSSTGFLISENSAV